VFGVFLPKTGSVSFAKELHGRHEYKQATLIAEITSGSPPVLAAYLKNYQKQYQLQNGCRPDIQTAYSLIGE
jgi:hypothetical protein